MDFQHKFLDLPDLETKSIGGKRHYHVDGEYYPSVTTVLSAKEQGEALKKWRERLGDEAADAHMRKSAARGDKLHSILERYVLNQEIDYKAEMPTTTELFMLIKPLLDEHVGNIYAIERPLYSKKLGVAGRVDFIADWKGKPAIIDFKSADRPKKSEWIDGYFMQEALYSFMAFEQVGLFTPQLVTLVASPGQSEAQVFEERSATWLPKALEIVELFYEKAANAKPSE